MSDSKFRKKAIDQMMAKKTLTPANQRRGYARASAVKKFLLELIAPELLELRARHDALEMYVTDLAVLVGGTRFGDDEEGAREILESFRKKALDDLPENDKLKHLSDMAIQKMIWKDIEDKMVRDIEKKQQKPLIEAAGLDGK